MGDLLTELGRFGFGSNILDQRTGSMMKDYLRWAVVLVGVGSLGACANRSTNTVRGPSTPENGGVVTNLDEQRASDLNPCDADRDGYDADSAECGGKDCDDTLADISPVALEKCDFIDWNLTSESI